MESIKQGKFTPLTRKQQLLIKGGVVTPGGSRFIYDFKVIDGKRYKKAHITSWSSDDTGGGTECYENLEHCTGEWEVY